MPEDFYDLFGVNEDANRDEISTAYRDLVREYHPDNNDKENARDQFKTIRIAREVLMDEESRERYDTYGHARYVDNFIEQELNGFEFSAEAQYSIDDPGPTPSHEQPDASEETNQSDEQGTGITTDQQTIEADPSTDGEEATISVEADDDYTGPDIPEEIYEDTGESGGTDIVFKPKINSSIVNMSWLVISTFAAYLVGVGTFIRQNAASVQQIVQEGAPLQGGRNGLPTLVETINNMAAAPTADPLLLLIPVGIAFIPLTIAVTVARFGTSITTWFYALGALLPAALLLYEAVLQPVAPAIETLVFVGVPFVIVFAFLTDILGRVIVQYVKYYWYHYGP